MNGQDIDEFQALSLYSDAIMTMNELISLAVRNNSGEAMDAILANIRRLSGYQKEIAMFYLIGQLVELRNPA